MAGLDQIFGGSQSVPLLSGPQMKYMTGIFNKVNPTIGKPTEIYGGQTLADVNPMMQNAIDSFGNASALAPGVDNALATQLSGAGNPDLVRARYEAALGPARQEFQDMMGQVGAHYGDVWGRSGAMPEMTGRATAQYGMGLNQLLADLVYSDTQANLDRQAAAIPMAMNLRNSNMNAAAGQFGMGQQQRALEQQRLSGNQANWTAQQWYSNPTLPLAQALMGVQTQGYVPQPGVFNQVVGAGQGLANAGMSLIRPL